MKVWATMKNFLQAKQHKPKNMPELKQKIKLFWKMLSPKMCSSTLTTCCRSCLMLSRRMELLLDTKTSYSVWNIACVLYISNCTIHFLKLSLHAVLHINKQCTYVLKQASQSLD